jgi:hypothetical protein
VAVRVQELLEQVARRPLRSLQRTLSQVEMAELVVAAAVFQELAVEVAPQDLTATAPKAEMAAAVPTAAVAEEAVATARRAPVATELRRQAEPQGPRQTTVVPEVKAQGHL